MEQVLDNLIAVSLVFLLLSLIVKGVQDILKHFFNNKENAMQEVLNAFIGPEAREGLSEALNAVFGQKYVGFLEHFDVDQFRELLDKADQQKIGAALVANLKESDIGKAKDVAVKQFTNALDEFQKLYEKKMGLSVFVISLVVVLLFNANVISIYEDIRTDAVTRNALVKVAEREYTTLIEVTEGKAERDIAGAFGEARDRIKNYLVDAPIIMRGVIGGHYQLYFKDFDSHPFLMLPGLLFSAFLVYLGAPFWHDLLQSLLSAKNLLKKKR